MPRRALSTRSQRSGRGGSIGLTWDGSLGQNIRQGGGVFLLVLQGEFDAVAQAMQAFAQSRHPWQNQTGAAERTFTVRVINRTMIEARHGVPYGIHLEYKHGGRYGIIPATLDVGKVMLRQSYAKAWASAWRFG